MSEQANFDDLRLGCIIIIKDGEAASPLPLEETRVSGQIIGPVASIQVTQQFSDEERISVGLPIDRLSNMDRSPAEVVAREGFH